MPKCYSYIRFSSKKQEQGDSYRRQRQLSTDWIFRNKHLGCYEDTELPTIEDLGVSGFSGANLDEETGALGKFVVLCREGKIDKGSYLILEQLDRFSRDEPLEAATLINKLVKRYGLKIVVLRPSEKIISKESLKDVHQLLIIILELAAAHSYSVTLSNRLKDSWKKRRNNATKEVKLNTKNIPSWIKLIIDKNKVYTFEKNIAACKAIEYIFKRILEGDSQRKICVELNENYPPIAKKTDGQLKNTGNYWTHAYVSRLISDRRLLGECQFYKKNDEKKMVPAGDPVENYYPVVIDENTFYKAQSSKKTHRRFNSIKHNSKSINIFRGLITCTNDNHKLYLKPGHTNLPSGKKYEYSRLASYGTKIGKSKFNLTIDYNKFEDLILDCLGELRAVDVKEVKNNKKEIIELEKVIHGINIKLEELRNRINSDDYAEEYGANLDREKVLKHKLKEKQNVLTNLSGSEPRSKKDILKDLKIFRPQNLTQLEQVSLRKKYLKVIPSIIKSIDITIVKFNNNYNGGYGVINLTSGKTRFFIFNPEKKIDDTIFHDENNNPVWLLTKNGSVFWERPRKQGVEGLRIVGKYQTSKNTQGSIIENSFDILSKIENKFNNEVDFRREFTMYTRIPDLEKLKACFGSMLKIK